MRETKIINLFAGPGAGKSTIASGIFYEMKKRHIKCDSPYEFPKELAWNESNKVIKDQLYVIANQHRGIVRSFGIVDYIILDSPLLLSLAYKDNYTSSYPANLYGDSFEKMMIDIHNKYDNINIFLERPIKTHDDDGRFHDEEMSIKLDNKIISILNDNGVSYTKIKVNDDTINFILDLVLQ
jgi:hypothetical protein|tara:strand:- start:26 stop:571 length:546 start_codon:yes stop_codon:yes gene_type:complete